MVCLRLSQRSELPLFDRMDRQAHARDFVLQTGLETHQRYFDDPQIVYLSIEDEGDFCGYFILVNEPDGDSVEFRRILIDQDKQGIGQLSILQMEKYCQDVLGAQRIWLDVFQSNIIGMHIYEKFGYKQFDEKLFEGRVLFFYEKFL